MKKDISVYSEKKKGFNFMMAFKKYRALMNLLDRKNAELDKRYEQIQQLESTNKMQEKSIENMLSNYKKTQKELKNYKKICSTELSEKDKKELQEKMPKLPKEKMQETKK